MADEQDTSGATGADDAGAATDTGQHDDPTAGLGEAGQKALAAERRAKTAAEKQAKAAQKQLDELSAKLQQYEDSQKSDLDKLTERASTAEKQAADAQTRLLRYEVAASKKLPSEWAARLQGSTQEELEADADSLLEALGTQQRQTAPSYDGGVRQTAKTNDMNSLIRQQAGLG